MKNIFGPDIRVLSGPLLVIIITAGLFTAGLNYSYSSITSNIEKYKVAKVMENSLEAKLDILKGVEAGSLERSNRLAQVLPDTNPGTIAINQIKTKAQDNLIEIGNISMQSETQASGNLSSVQFNYELSTLDTDSMVSFLELLDNLAPINNLKNVELTVDTDGFMTGKVESFLYWSGYPETIASVTAPIADLTEAELNQINAMSSYLLPSFSDLRPGSPTDRESPFN